MHRQVNQDSYRALHVWNDEATLLVVCDGMGGHAMGEVASETVCNAVCDYWLRPNNDDSVVKARRACRSASAKLDERSFGMNHVQMGTTLVMASIEGDTITITHCGDSRCYLLRDGEVVYQTRRNQIG